VGCRKKHGGLQEEKAAHVLQQIIKVLGPNEGAQSLFSLTEQNVEAISLCTISIPICTQFSI